MVSIQRSEYRATELSEKMKQNTDRAVPENGSSHQDQEMQQVFFAGLSALAAVALFELI